MKKEIEELLIRLSADVHAELGCGLLEKPYQNALFIAAKNARLRVEKERCYPVYYRRQLVGEYFADLVVEDRVIVECKAVFCLHRSHCAQLYHYLRISGISSGLLINFANEELVTRRLRV